MARVRVQPLDIEISEDTPFENDQLGREEFIETLTSIVSNIDGPCIMSIDAPWGAGKTTFLKMWEVYLRGKNFVVVNFNAWESDFLEEPFVALSSEIIQELKEGRISNTLAVEVESLAIQAKQIIVQSLPTLASSVAGSLPIFGPLAGVIVKTTAERILSSHQKTQHSIKRFNCQLKRLAKKLSDANEGRPLIVIIDELDRCRPLYAIELLETAKHIFNADNVIFALSTNQQQMAASVKAIYGDKFLATEYLERFFDISLSLPNTDRKKFIETTLETAQIHEKFHNRYFKEAFVAVLNASGLSLREVTKAIHHLRLVYASLDPGVQMERDITAMLMIFRAINQRSFQDFIHGVSTDQQIRNNLSAFMPTRSQDVKSTGAFAVYEATVLATNMHVRGDRSDAEALVTNIFTNKSLLPGDELPLRQTLEKYVHAVIQGLRSPNQIDMERLIRKIELTAQDELIEAD